MPYTTCLTKLLLYRNTKKAIKGTFFSGSLGQSAGDGVRDVFPLENPPGWL